MVRAPLVLSFAAALAACRPAPVADPVVAQRLAAVEVRLDQLAAALAQGRPAAAALPPVPVTADDRLARVEARLDKLVAFLKQAVRPELDTSLTYAIPIDPADPVLGPATAKVTVVEAYEYLCPYCAMVAPTVEKVRARYPKDVRVVSKYFLIHGEPAVPAGLGACAAAKQGAARFAAYQQAVWATIWPEMSKPALREHATADEIEKLAKGSGLDVARFKKDVAGADCQAWIERTGQVMQRFGVSGTPSFYVNGRAVDGDKLDGAIVDALAAVDASGVAPARYYQDVVLKTGAPEAHMISPFE
jgi:protein-disulfide isomerase